MTSSHKLAACAQRRCRSPVFSALVGVTVWYTALVSQEVHVRGERKLGQRSPV